MTPKPAPEKWREWSLFNTISGWRVSLAPLHKSSGEIRVIERSALDAANAEIERLRGYITRHEATACDQFMRKERDEARQEWDMLKHSYDDLHAHMEKQNTKLTAAERALERCEELFRYCYGPTRDVKTYKLKEGEEIAKDTLATIREGRGE